KDRYVRSFSSTPLISSSTISSMSIRVSSSSAMELSTAALESWPRSSRRSLSRCYWDRHRPLELAEGLDAKLSAGRSRRSGRCGWDGPHGVFQRASLVESAGKIARLLRLRDARRILEQHDPVSAAHLPRMEITKVCQTASSGILIYPVIPLTYRFLNHPSSKLRRIRRPRTTLRGIYIIFEIIVNHDAGIPSSRRSALALRSAFKRAPPSFWRLRKGDGSD